MEVKKIKKIKNKISVPLWIKNKLHKIVLWLMTVLTINTSLEYQRQEIDRKYSHIDTTNSQILDKKTIDCMLKDAQYEILRSYFPDTFTFDCLCDVTTDQTLLRNLYYVWLKYWNPRIMPHKNLITLLTDNSNNFFGSVSAKTFTLDLFISELAHQPQVAHYWKRMYWYFGIRDNIFRSWTGNTGMEFVAHDTYEKLILLDLLDEDYVSHLLCQHSSAKSYAEFIREHPEYDDLRSKLEEHFGWQTPLADQKVSDDLLKYNRMLALLHTVLKIHRQPLSDTKL